MAYKPFALASPEEQARRRALQRAATARWNAKHPERRLEISKASYRKYRAKNIARVQAWQARNPEKQKAAQARYEKRHPEKRPEWTQRWRDKNPERYKAACLKRTKAKWAAHPEIRKAYYQAWRARRRNTTAETITPSAWAAQCELFGSRCAYCLRDAPLTQDHLVPLSRGGTHTLDNLVPACSACNKKKHAMTLLRFLWKRCA